MRQHLASANKYANQTFGINLNDLETLQRYLDMRFVQLNAAARLELWQEAFRTTEDIQSLLSASNRPSKPFMMASYYENLARTFMVGENYLFHAAAWNKYYETVQGNKNLPDEEMDKIASLVLISSLAIPIGIGKGASDNHFICQVEKSRDKRFINLLRVEKVPTRDQLVKESVCLDISKFSLDLIFLLEYILNLKIWFKFWKSISIHYSFVKKLRQCWAFYRKEQNSKSMSSLFIMLY